MTTPRNFHFDDGRGHSRDGAGSRRPAGCVSAPSRESHAEFYDLLHAFDERTDCPVLINTSFNVRGEPIVCSPDDAYLCFMRTNMDLLVLGNQLLLKDDQPELHEDFDWRERFALD